VAPLNATSGYGRIEKAGAATKCLDLFGHLKTDGTKLDVYGCLGSESNQQVPYSSTSDSSPCRFLKYIPAVHPAAIRAVRSGNWTAADSS